MSQPSKRKVAYFYDKDIGNYYMGPGHPMKPHRIRMVQNLILHYGLHNKMEVFKPTPATPEDLMVYHSEAYVRFLMSVTPQTQELFMKQAKMYSMNKDDCPIFEDLYKFCQSYTGGSVGGAVKLNYQSSDCVINWSGGLHHAKKSEASGFCYINDIVLAILELLKYHKRVLYVDIDVHHGDGVEEAFYHTDRVMTISFHKYGDDFFPGTGDLSDLGHGKGYGYAINAPLKDGMTDAAYLNLFRPVMARLMEIYQPEAVVFQSGADSLAGDELGPFNLTVKGHAACLMFMESFKIPMLVLGGGGYTINNVARCWTYETGQLLGEELADDIPPNEYREYFAPDYKLQISESEKLENANSTKYLEDLRIKLLQNLSKLNPVPSVQFQERPPDAMPHDSVVGVRGGSFGNSQHAPYLANRFSSGPAQVNGHSAAS